MNRLFASALCLAFATTLSGCLFNKPSSSNQTANQAAPAPSGTTETEAKTELAPTPAPPQAGELQPGQASGSYTAKGEVVELKYAYAGRAERFGNESLVVLLTEKPIPAEALANEFKSPDLLEGEKIRGLEYVLDDDTMWVRFHPGQYQETTSNKLKEYKTENGIVRGIDENDGNLTNGRYSRSVKFVAAIAK